MDGSKPSLATLEARNRHVVGYWRVSRVGDRTGDSYISPDEQKQKMSAMAVLLGVTGRLERGQMRNPPIRYLVNLSYALGCRLDELIEDEWLEWLQLNPDAPAKPPRGTLQRAPRDE